MAVADLDALLPGPAQAGAKPEHRITLVNDFAVEEVQVNVGTFDFGHGITAKTTIAVWRNRQHETPSAASSPSRPSTTGARLHRQGLHRPRRFL